MWETNSRMFNDALGNYRAVKSFGKEECETIRLADYQNAVHLAEYEAGRLDSLVLMTQTLCNTMMQATLLLLAGKLLFAVGSACTVLFLAFVLCCLVFFLFHCSIPLSPHSCKRKAQSHINI